MVLCDPQARAVDSRNSQAAKEYRERRRHDRNRMDSSVDDLRQEVTVHFGGVAQNVQIRRRLTNPNTPEKLLQQNFSGTSVFCNSTDNLPVASMALKTGIHSNIEHDRQSLCECGTLPGEVQRAR